jgi:hypothetical protein
MMFLINPFIFAGGGDFESIASVAGNNTTTTYTFDNIPQTFQHLQLRICSPFNAQDGTIQLTFNGATSTYRNHILYGNGAYSVAYSQLDLVYDTNISRNSSTNKVAIVDILDYGSTTKNKVIRSFEGVDTNDAGVVALNSGAWFSTTAITSITLKNQGNGGSYGLWNFLTGASLALYGVRA